MQASTTTVSELRVSSHSRALNSSHPRVPASGQAKENDPPVLVVEVARSKTTDDLTALLPQWVLRRPQGGGANLAVGIAIR